MPPPAAPTAMTMIYNDALEQLYNRYLFERPECPFTLEQFERLLKLYPALLVMHADGHADTTEMLTLYKLGRHLLHDLDEEVVRKEVRALNWNTAYWKDPFMRVLKEKVALQNCGWEVMDFMITAASASTGNLRHNVLVRTLNPHNPQDAAELAEKIEFVSASERKAILDVADYLELTEDEGLMAMLSRFL